MYFSKSNLIVSLVLNILWNMKWKTICFLVNSVRPLTQSHTMFSLNWRNTYLMGGLFGG